MMCLHNLFSLRFTKCETNEVRTYCKRTFREGKDKRVKYSDADKIRIIKLYLENIGVKIPEGKTKRYSKNIDIIEYSLCLLFDKLYWKSLIVE